MINELLLENCKKGNRQAQRQVYNDMTPKLYSTCRRYLKENADIEDVLSEAFYKIFTGLSDLKDAGAFEAWARRIAVNQCLQVLRRKTNFNLSLEDIKTEPIHESQITQQKDLLKLLNYLPAGCRTIFNLYAIEGYAHKEIAAMLDIAEGTSKSQLNVAKNKLQDLVKKFYYQNSTKDGIAK